MNSFIGAMIVTTFATAFARTIIDIIAGMLPFRRLVFMTSVDAVATKRAMAYVTKHHNFAGAWLTNCGHTIPIGWVFSWKMMWAAHVDLAPGQRRWGEESMSDINIYWPVWRTPPTELVHAPQPRVMRKGATMLFTMVKMTSDYCAWNKDEQVFNIDRCPPAATVAAKSMMDHVRQTDTRSGVFYVNGPPDTGKTSSGMILSKLLGAYYVDSYDFMNKGHKLSCLLRDASPEMKAPLVIGMSEADVKILAVMHKNIDKKKAGGDVYDKGTLNSLLDAINYTHEDVILVLTGNTPFKHLELQLGDPSCTKATRMTVVCVGGDSDFCRDDNPVNNAHASTIFGKHDINSNNDTDSNSDTDSSACGSDSA